MAAPNFEIGRCAPETAQGFPCGFRVIFFSPSNFTEGSHRQTDAEAHLSLLLDRSIRRSSALSTESLCLVAGSKVWSLVCTIHVLDHDGDLLSASCIAAIAALSHFRIPDTSIQGGELRLYSTQERNPIPLALLHWPFCVSFAVFEGGEKVIVDATLQEEQCSEGEVVVTANKSGEICAISKQGGMPTDALVLLGCVDTALEKVRVIDEIVRKALDLDATQRDVGGWMAQLRAENAR